VLRPALILTAVAAAMISSPAATLAARAPSAGTYRGATAEGRAITLTVAAGRVTRVDVAVVNYACDLEGDIGPLAVKGAPRARIGAAGRFGGSSGPTSERMRIDGRFGRGASVRGSLRLRGTVGTGEPCSSPRIRFSARRVG